MSVSFAASSRTTSLFANSFSRNERTVLDGLRSARLPLKDVFMTDNWSQLSLAFKEQVAMLLLPKLGSEWSLVYVSADTGIATFGRGGMLFNLIPGGEFRIGSDHEADPYAYFDETKGGMVSVDPFLLAQTPTTTTQFRDNGGDVDKCDNTYNAAHPNNPITGIDWTTSTAWCESNGLTLPSEAQWEYACRAGTTSRYWWGHEFDESRAWCNSNTGHAINYRVKPCNLDAHRNPWGLYDMSGNVFEWCEDNWFDNYEGLKDDKPRTDDDSSLHVMRGGSWDDTRIWVRSAQRLEDDRWSKYAYVGFRAAKRIDW